MNYFVPELFQRKGFMKTSIRDFSGLALVAALCLMLSSCSGRPDDDILRDVYGLGEAKTSSDASVYYTADTVKFAQRSDDYSDILLSIERKIFVKDSEYSVVEKRVDGNRAFVRIKIDKNPELNLVGLELEIPFKYESGKWKIDRADDISKTIEK